MKQLTAFTFLFAGAVAGRVALQFVPSVEPIIPLAILAGLVFGPKEGFALGSGAYVASNFFVWGLQGPWTLFQAVGAGVPGAIAGLVGKAKHAHPNDLVLFSVLGTVFFEVVMNVTGALMMGGLFGLGLLTIPLYFLTSAPFSLVHVASNIAFAAGLRPLLSKWSRKKDELEIIVVNRTVGDKRTAVRMYRTR
jgi:energy-coupling factor transport system substrate-specific component